MIVRRAAPIIIREWNNGRRSPIKKAILMQKVIDGPPIIHVVRRSEDASGPNTSLPPHKNF